MLKILISLFAIVMLIRCYRAMFDFGLEYYDSDAYPIIQLILGIAFIFICIIVFSIIIGA